MHFFEREVVIYAYMKQLKRAKGAQKFLAFFNKHFLMKIKFGECSFINIKFYKIFKTFHQSKRLASLSKQINLK
jgi:hypothetical protein